jgi:pyruvate formate lyase activating enzyme
MRIGGIIDVSTKDIPNKCCMVIFTVGCNLNCSFCQNKYLLDLNVGKDWKIKEILEYVKSNFLVDSLSITGGEPTLQEDLIELCKEIKKIGKYISLDTNGTNPKIIKELIPYIDRVALD